MASVKVLQRDPTVTGKSKEELRQPFDELEKGPFLK